MNASLKPLPPTDSFLRETKAFGIAFDPGDLSRLGKYLAMLLEANTQFNLTAITDPHQAWIKHIFDSLTLLPHLVSATKLGSDGLESSPGAKQTTRVIDIGSGGGLPGVPLAIVMPALQFTLCEATGKKAEFLSQVARTLQLPNLNVLNHRAETIGRDPDHRERYDGVVARAVGRLAVLVELAAPLARVGGHVLAIKGQKASQEVDQAKRALHLLHCAIVKSDRTPTGTVVAFKKLRATPKRYPRRPGEPKRAPLGVAPPCRNL